MKYELVGIIDRNVEESFEAVIEAPSPEEAQDILYEILSEYPNSEFVADQLLKLDVKGSRPTSVSIEFRGPVEEEEVVEDNAYD